MDSNARSGHGDGGALLYAHRSQAGIDCGRERRLMDSPLILLAFLSLFHILGGGVLGVVMRGWRMRPAETRGCGMNVGLMIWALGFGCAPLFLGLQTPRLLPFQLLELAVVFCVTFFFWDRIRESFAKPEMIKIVFGGVFFVAGCAAGGMLLEARETLMAAVFGLIFGGIGLAFILPGMRNMLKPPTGPKEEEEIVAGE